VYPWKFSAPAKQFWTPPFQDLFFTGKGNLTIEGLTLKNWRRANGWDAGAIHGGKLIANNYVFIANQAAEMNGQGGTLFEWGR
jgi:hypothetical protein